MILLAPLALALTLSGCAPAATPAHTSRTTTSSTAAPAVTAPLPHESPATPEPVDYLGLCQDGATSAGLGHLSRATVGARQNDGSLRVTVSDGMSTADCYVKAGKVRKFEVYG